MHRRDHSSALRPVTNAGEPQLLADRPRRIGVSDHSGPRDTVVEVPAVSGKQHAELDYPKQSHEESRRSDQSPPNTGLAAGVSDESQADPTHPRGLAMSDPRPHRCPTSVQMAAKTTTA